MDQPHLIPAGDVALLIDWEKIERSLPDQQLYKEVPHHRVTG
jgi:hypothetical protein